MIPRRTILRTQIQRPGRGRGRKVWYTWPLIVPPIYAKQALLARLRDAWDDARDAVEKADRVRLDMTNASEQCAQTILARPFP